MNDEQLEAGSRGEVMFSPDEQGGEHRPPKPMNDEQLEAGSRNEVMFISPDEQGGEHRPPKPAIPPRHACRADERWIAAYQRECATIIAKKAQVELEKDATGAYIFPLKCIVYRVNVVHEFKWKLDPLLQEFRWYECARFTADSSRDRRQLKPGHVYAATPDIGLVLFWMGIIACKGMYVEETDAVRAYLQAPTIDDTIILVYHAFIQRMGMPKYARITSGFYGTLMAALGFNKFSDHVFLQEGWSKCDVARCMYIKHNEVMLPV